MKYLFTKSCASLFEGSAQGCQFPNTPVLSDMQIECISMQPVKGLRQRVINLSGSRRQDLAETHIATAPVEEVAFKLNLR